MIAIEDAAGAVAALRICRYFPSDDLQRSQIAAILIEMVGSKDQLDWLVKEQSKLDWEGTKALRNVFCSRFKPLDTVYSQDPETQAAQMEADYFAAQSAETARRIEGWKKERKLLGEAPVRIDVTPAAKRIGETRTERGVRMLAKDKKTRDYLERC